MINQIYLSVFQTRRATHLVGHHSHLRLLALSGLPIGLGRGLGLISTGHDYWRGERGEKHSERVCSFGRSSMFDGAKEGCMRDGSMWNNLYFFFFCTAPYACVPYLSVCAMPVPSLTQSVCASECASAFYTLAPIGGGLWAEKQTC